MSESTEAQKLSGISKREVWDAYRRVKENQGAAGVDGVAIEDFEADLKNNLYPDFDQLVRTFGLDDQRERLA